MIEKGINVKTLDDLLSPLLLRNARLDVKKATSPLSSIASKFGGSPYQEFSEKWPTCASCSKGLTFICQIDLRQTLHPVRDDIHFFTFFYCEECSPCGAPDDTGAWLVRKYRNPDEQKAVVALPPQEVRQLPECRISFVEGRSLPDWEGARRWSLEASDLACELNGDAPWETYREAVERLAGEQAIESRVGGYPRWIQGEETPEGCSLLAQIDSEADANIMWGDVGSVYLFVSDDLERRINLVEQCC